jgi:hypothetical protein
MRQLRQGGLSPLSDDGRRRIVLPRLRHTDPGTSGRGERSKASPRRPAKANENFRLLRTRIRCHGSSNDHEHTGRPGEGAYTSCDHDGLSAALRLDGMVRCMDPATDPEVVPRQSRTTRGRVGQNDSAWLLPAWALRIHHFGAALVPVVLAGFLRCASVWPRRRRSARMDPLPQRVGRRKIGKRPYFPYVLYCAFTLK